jgi:hypothetical protein
MSRRVRMWLRRGRATSSSNDCGWRRSPSRKKRGCGLDAECTAVGLVAADPLERRRVGVVGVELRHVEADLFGECAEEGVERDLLLTQEAWVSNIFEYIASNWS